MILFRAGRHGVGRSILGQSSEYDIENFPMSFAPNTPYFLPFQLICPGRVTDKCQKHISHFTTSYIFPSTLVKSSQISDLEKFRKIHLLCWQKYNSRPHMKISIQDSNYFDHNIQAYFFKDISVQLSGHLKQRNSRQFITYSH